MIRTTTDQDNATMKTRLFHFIGIVFIGAVLLALTLGGCSGSGSGGADAEDGTLVIGLTDAEGDFLRYEVDVVSLTLTKQNGAVVDALPVQTRVDFAQYTEMTEFLTAATVPTGRYIKATMMLDYRNADIQIEDADGNAVAVETILDEDGSPITTLPVAVHLEGRNSLVIAPGIPAHLTLDFNLEASNQVVNGNQNRNREGPCLQPPEPAHRGGDSVRCDRRQPLAPPGRPPRGLREVHGLRLHPRVQPPDDSHGGRLRGMGTHGVERHRPGCSPRHGRRAVRRHLGHA